MSMFNLKTEICREECGLFLYVGAFFAGLGVTLARPPRSNHRSGDTDMDGDTEAVAGTPAWVHFAAAGVGVVAVAIVLWAGRG